MRIRVLVGFVVVAALAGTGTGWAQGGGSVKIGGGVKAGLNLGTISGEVCDGGSACEKSMRKGAVAGAYIKIPAGQYFAFQPEVLFAQGGVKIKQGSQEGTVKIDEIQIPLLARFGRRPTADRAAAYVVVGPVIGKIAKAEQEFGGQTEDFKDELNSADIGIAVGGGVVVRRFLVEVRYTGSVRKLDKSANEDHKSRVVSFMVGVDF